MIESIIEVLNGYELKERHIGTNKYGLVIYVS